MVSPFKTWVVSYDGPCEDVPDAAVLLMRKKQRPADWMSPSTLRMRVEFSATANQFYTADTSRHAPTLCATFHPSTHRPTINAALARSAQARSLRAGRRCLRLRAGSHTAPWTCVLVSDAVLMIKPRSTSGVLRGWLRLQVGEERWEVDARGVRDKSWGAREWSGSGSVVPRKKRSAPSGRAGAGGVPRAPQPHIHWFSVTFGDRAALNASCGRAPDGTMRGQGWLQTAGGQTQWFRDVLVTSEFQEADAARGYANELLHTRMRLTGRAEDGTVVDMTGVVNTVCPTKVGVCAVCRPCHARRRPEVPNPAAFECRGGDAHSACPSLMVARGGLGR